MTETIDTADIVYHRPSGEAWVVASVQDDHLYWCGWPPGRANLKDCELTSKASPKRRDSLLAELAESEHACASWAKDRLARAATSISTKGDGPGCTCQAAGGPDYCERHAP